jgi:putative DNA primase/helicase
LSSVLLPYTVIVTKTLVTRGRSSVGDDLVDLVGAMLISVSETEEGEALAEAKIKQMTG